MEAVSLDAYATAKGGHSATHCSARPVSWMRIAMPYTAQSGRHKVFRCHVSLRRHRPAGHAVFPSPCLELGKDIQARPYTVLYAAVSFRSPVATSSLWSAFIPTSAVFHLARLDSSDSCSLPRHCQLQPRSLTCRSLGPGVVLGLALREQGSN